MKNDHPEDNEILLEEIAGLKQRIMELERLATPSDGVGFASQNHADQAHGEGEWLYRVAAELSGQVVWDLDPKTGKIVWGGAIEAMTGFTPEALQDVDLSVWEKMIHPDDRKRTLSLLEAAIQDGTQYHCEYRFRKKDTAYIVVETCGRVFSRDTGIRMLGVMQDITARKAAEQTLMASESKYRVLFEASNDPIFILENNICIECNSAACKMYSLSKEQILGSRPWDYSPPFQDDGKASRESALEKIDAALSTRSQFFEWKLTGPDGEVFHVEVSLGRIEFEGRVCILGIVRDITDRKRMEIELKASEQIYRAVFESTRTPLLFSGEDMTILRVNREFEKQSGFSREELEGRRKWTDLIATQEDLARMVEYNRLRRIDPGAVPDAYEFKMVTKGGALRDVLVNVSIISESNMTLGAMLDITDRKKAEQAIKASELNLRTIFDNTYDAIFVHDAHGKILDVNQTLLDMYGISRAQALTLSVLQDFSTPNNPLDEMEQRWRRVLEGESLAFEWESRRPGDGSVFDVEVALTGITLEERKVVLANVRDISLRKATMRTLKESEEKFRALAEHNIDSIMRFDHHHRHLYVNPVVEQATGIPAADFIGKTGREIGFSEEMCTFWEDAIDRVFHSGKVQRIELQRYGDEWFDWILMPESDGNGVVTAVIASGRNITDLRALEEQLRQSQKMEAIGQLAGGVAHDFNNMLQAIMGYSDIVLSSRTLDDRDREKLLEVRKAAQRASELTGQLLAFSRRQVLHLGPLDLNLIVMDLLNMLQRLIGENIELTFTREKALWTVSADKGQMEQVLMNLCINARDAMPRGGQLVIETANVTLDDEFCAHFEWAQPGQYAQLSVTDTGCGMNAETSSKVFEPFFTTKETGRGTGLGLATVYGIVRQHQGMIHVVSDIGKGSRFNVYLPIIATIQVETMAEPDRVPVAGGHETILVAEDDEFIRALAGHILETAGYRVFTAVDGEDAVCICRDHGKEIDLLLLDVVMPKKSGREVFDEIRSANPTIKCLFMSGYSKNAPSIRFIQEQKYPLIQKPFKNEELLRMIRSELDRPR